MIKVHSVIDPSVIANKVFHFHSVFHLRVVEIRVQHDDGVRHNKGRILGGQMLGLGGEVNTGECLHHPFDLL